MAKHVHAEVIKAWADGAEIEWRNDSTDTWKKLEGHAERYPYWQSHYQYRVKPKQQERWFNIYDDSGFSSKEEANHFALMTGEKRVACVKIVFTERDGL